MRALFTLASGLGLLLLQSVLLQLVPVYLPTPALGVLVALHVGLSPRWTVSSSVFVGFSLGYLFDLVSGAPRGTHALVYSLLALAAALLGPRLTVRGLFLRAAAGVLVAFLGGWLVVAVRVLAGSGTPPGGVRLVLLEAVVTGALAPLVLGLLDRLDGRLDAARGEAGMVARGGKPASGGLELPRS
jgi:rod shape-determining protein MreD